MTVPITIIVHSLNEEVNIPFVLDNVVGWADQVCVIDSDSSDGTQRIVREKGAELYSRACTREGLVEQRNWALENIPFRNEWVFILDADEWMEPEIKSEVERLIRNDDGTKDGYWCRFKLIFMGKWIKRSSMYPSWSMRLFRHKLVRYEKRDVNSHPLVQPGREGYLQEHIHNEDRRGFSYYIKRLDEFSTLEARAYDKRRRVVGQEAVLVGRLFGTSAERRRFLKNLFIRLPLRPALLFVYLYFVRMGFLDGRVGFDYAFYKAVCEWAINVKHFESQMS
jgi:glycosyltransferase involved in cell wall biosynthesis